jgi:uncharacterized protein YndB with AHSA1/START domain
METTHFTVSQTIRKPVAEIFHAIVDPDILSTYFTKASSGPLESGAKVTWYWSGNEEEYFYVDNVIPSEKIEGHWKAWKVDYHVNTIFTFISKEDGSTLVRISEDGFHNDELGRESSYGQCSGWTHMLLSLKARLEFDIDLR